MRKKERIFGLSEKDRARFEEEFERKLKEKGIQENEVLQSGEVIPPRLFMPEAPGPILREKDKPGRSVPEEKDFEYYLAEWKNEHRDYELTHLSPDVVIKLQREDAYDLPLEFVDHLIDRATKSDMPEDDRRLLFSILRNLDKVLIYNTASMIQIGLRDNERRLIRLYFEAKRPFVFLQSGVVG